MRVIPVIGDIYAAVHDWLQGRPSFVLSAGLVAFGLFCLWGSAKLPAEAKAVLLAWIILP